MSAGFTRQTVTDALKVAAAADWNNAVQVFKDRGTNLGEDLKLADEALTVAALLGVPDAALADALVKLVIFLKPLLDSQGADFNQRWSPSLEQVIHPTRRGQIA